MVSAMTTSEEIIEACKIKEGLSRAELSTILAKRYETVSSLIDYLLSKDRLHRAGVTRYYRFFANRDDALAWDLIADADYVKHREEAKGRVLQAAADYKREKRGSTKAYKPRAKRVELVISQDRTAQVSHAATVIWPDSVKVQVHPTPPSRYAFVPEPGWRGAITSDWIDRRMSEVSAA